MHHFLGFIWDAGDETVCAAARRLQSKVTRGNDAWREVFNESGLTVFEREPFTGSPTAQPLPKRAGVVLGSVFPMHLDSWTDGWTWKLSERDADYIIETQGRSMMAQIWGGYIAFLYDKCRRSVYVIRDCSGKIPCYRAQHDGVEIVFADLADLRDLRLPAFGMNLEYVAAFACSSQLQIRATGLDQVTELLAGDCLKVQSGVRSQHSLWNPVCIFDAPRVDNFESAAAEVRFTAQRCVDAWSSAFERISIHLSGGLDSAVVLGCLRSAKQPAALTCINRYGQAAVEDERRYARVAAAAAGVALMEFPFHYDDSSIDERLCQFPLTTKPTLSGTLAKLDVEFCNNLVRQCAADSIWTGQGGDHLFLQTRGAFSARDYLELNGFNLGLLRAVGDASRLSKQPYWMTLRTLTSRNLQRPGSDPSSVAESMFVTLEARSRISREYLRHPWVSDAERLSPGRQFQVAALSEVLNRHRPLPGLEAVYEHHPLLSQPLIELCLRIPSYVHLRSGLSRAVERAAFRDLVPAEIVARQQKGQITMSMLDTLHRSEAFVRELMMDGILAREGILDRAAIEPFLCHRRPVQIDHTFPLFACIAAELWARTWVTSGA